MFTLFRRQRERAEAVTWAGPGGSQEPGGQSRSPLSLAETQGPPGGKQHDAGLRVEEVGLELGTSVSEAAVPINH